MRTIQEILSSIGTDKHNDTEHSYGDVYAEIFNQYDRGGKLNILELGVQRGGSLCAWQEYFPNAKIYGVDILDARQDDYKDKRITFILADLKDAINQLKDIKFDIIIDDSDHNEQTMAWIAEHYFPLLNEGGTLVFEDVQIPELYIQTIKDSMPDNAIMDTFDMRGVKDRPDDYIITLKK